MKEASTTVVQTSSRNRFFTALIACGMMLAISMIGYASWSLYQEHNKAVAYEQQKAAQEAIKSEITATVSVSVSAQEARDRAATDTDPAPIGIPADSAAAQAWNDKIAQWQDKEDDPSLPGQGDTPLTSELTWVTTTDNAGNTIRVPAIAPNVLTIPAVGLQVPLVSRGAVRNAAGQLEMSLPHSAFASISTIAAPLGSSAGNTVIAGHVNYGGSLAPVAPMSLITRTKPGMKVYVSDASGKVYAFAVSAIEPNVPHDELASRTDFFSRTGQRFLQLVTCGGTPESGKYTHNVIVTAVPL